MLIGPLVGIVAGVALLYLGGEFLVHGASSLARIWGLRPMVIGLTVVAFGTSAPELAASLTAALAGSPGIAVGNVVGSNIANIGLILAITALIHPLSTGARFLRREMPVMLATAVLLILLFLDGILGRLEGALFVALLLVFLTVLFRGGEEPEVQEEFAREYAPETKMPAPLWRSTAGVFFGLAILVLGARLLVTGATSIAREAGVPELIIGLTIVAVGTSLPELAASVVAALKREPDIALGNIVGSNIFNVLAILGGTVLIRPIAFPFIHIAIDLGAMLIVSLLLWPFLATGLRLGRREGVVLLGLYSGFVAYRFLA